MNEPYMIIESWAIPQAEPEQKEFTFAYGPCSLGYKHVIYDCFIEGPLFEALLWDYFHQHFYEWVRL